MTAANTQLSIKILALFLPSIVLFCVAEVYLRYHYQTVNLGIRSKLPENMRLTSSKDPRLIYTFIPGKNGINSALEIQFPIVDVTQYVPEI